MCACGGWRSRGPSASVPPTPSGGMEGMSHPMGHRAVHPNQQSLKAPSPNGLSSDKYTRDHCQYPRIQIPGSSGCFFIAHQKGLPLGSNPPRRAATLLEFANEVIVWAVAGLGSNCPKNWPELSYTLDRALFSLWFFCQATIYVLTVGSALRLVKAGIIKARISLPFEGCIVHESRSVKSMVHGNPWEDLHHCEDG